MAVNNDFISNLNFQGASQLAFLSFKQSNPAIGSILQAHLPAMFRKIKIAAVMV